MTVVVLRSGSSLDEIYKRQINLHGFIRMNCEDLPDTDPRRSRSSVRSDPDYLSALPTTPPARLLEALNPAIHQSRVLR